MSLSRWMRVAGSGGNYASDDPPAAGYALRRAIAPDGTEYFGNSIFNSYSSDIDTIVDSLLDWKAREASMRSGVTVQSKAGISGRQSYTGH